ncbi:MAG: AsmA family protein [Methylococcaceae bacterium]|nr:AsmA family protein [Methylococcaceae bacterium]
MKKPLKIALLLAGILAAGLLLAIIGVWLLIDPNNFKPELAALVKQRTGRALSIPGDLKFAIFPAPGFKVGKMTLSNAANFPDKAFAEITAADVRIKWMPLLKNKIELGKIQLYGLVLNLSKNKQGESNWADLSKRPQAGEITPPLDVSTTDKRSAETFSVDQLSLEQGHIRWEDQQAERVIDVTEVQVTADNLGLARPITLSLGFNLSKRGVASEHKIQLRAQLNLDNALDVFNAKDIMVSAYSTGEQIPGGHLTVAGLIKAVEYQQTLQTFKVEGLQASALNLSLNADLSGHQLRNNPDIRGTVQVAAFNPKQFLQQQTLAIPATQDPTVLSSLAADLAVQATDHSLTLNHFNVKLDQTRLKGSAELVDFKQPVITFSAEIDTLDVDRYFAPQAKVPTPILSSSVVIAATNQAVQPLERLKNLSLNGKLLIRQLKMNHLDMQEVSLDMQSKTGQIQTQQTIKQLYQGFYQGNASLSLLDNMPHITVDEKIAHINLEPFLSALSANAQLTGVLDASAQLHGQGNTAKALKASLAGDVQFLVENGAIKGLNLQKLLDNLKSLLSGQIIAPAYNSEQSLFSHLKGTANVKAGIIENHDLVADATNIAVNGEGNVDLNTDQIAYKLKARLLNAATPIKELNAWPLILSISGNLSNPNYRVDSIGALLEENEQKIEEKKTELLEKLDKTLHKKLGIGASELLKKLF